MPNAKISCPTFYARMYVPSSVSNERDKWHREVKLVELFNLLKKPVLLDTDYSAAHFHDLHAFIFTQLSADAVRIYFAAFPDESNDPLVPSRYEGAATLLYVPCEFDSTTSEYVDLDYFLMLHPYKGLINVGSIVGKNWINDFRGNSKILQSLTSIVKKHIPSYPYNTDTQSILHTRKDFNEFLVEVDCHNTFQVRARFSSYHNNETSPTGKRYLCRTMVVYELIDADGKIINITKEGRMQQSIINKEGKEILGDDFNNGSLCPPDICGY
jgi:hypothetical protein